MRRFFSVSSLALVFLAVPGAAFGQAVPHVHLIGETHIGSNWNARGLQLEVGVTHFRVAAEAVWNDDAGAFSASALGFLPTDWAFLTLYGGAGVGLFATYDVPAALIPVRLGIEVPLTPQLLAVRLEARAYLIESERLFALLLGVRVP